MPAFIGPTSDRTHAARLSAGTTALVLWDGPLALVLIAHTIPSPRWAAVAVHARTHRDDLAAETAVACQVATCPVAATWLPDLAHRAASGL